MKVGNDLVEVERFYKLLSNESFIKRVFTDKEMQHINSFNYEQKKAERKGGKYAGKEAVAKAIGFGIAKGVSFNEIEILPNNDGKPQVSLSGKTKVIFNSLDEKNIEISISNTKNLASAVCIIF